ncbi:MAG TPA: PKD domain-containing protein, partial [Bacteroidia bacterium]
MKNLITLLLIAFCLNGHSQCSLTVTVNSATICAGTSATLTASGTSSYTWTPTASLNTNTGASVIASPTITTIYTVTGTTGTCTASNTTTVVVNPTPIANFFGVDTIGCSPLSTAFTDLSTLSGGTIFSWNWNFGNGQTSNQHYPISQTYTNASATNAAYYTVSLTITSNNG